MNKIKYRLPEKFVQQCGKCVYIYIRCGNRSARMEISTSSNRYNV